MKSKNKSTEEMNKDGPSPYQVRLPGFLIDEDIGLGDMIKRTTNYLGIRPCGSCERRAAALNSWLVFTNQKNK